MIIFKYFLLLYVLVQRCCIADEHFDFWTGLAQNIVMKHVNVDIGQKKVSRIAENVILVNAPGLTGTAIRTAEWYQKQKYNVGLFYDEFPVVGFANTFCTRGPTVEGECVGSLFLAKNENKSKKDVIESLAQWALDSGKDVGIVTTSRLTSSSITPMFGRENDTEWYANSNTGDDKFCQDMACHLLLKNPGKRFKVILGGGMKDFVSNSTKIFDGSYGQRSDGRNIINEWIDDKKKRNLKYKYVENRSELLRKDKGAEYLLGLFDSDNMEFHLKNDYKGQPSLTEMVRTAINLLSKNGNGYFLFVFDGSIDEAHRNNRARLALDQTVQLSAALETLSHSTDAKNTLIVLTGDHGSTMTMSGYPSIDHDVLKVATKKEHANYSIITYGNGPGFRTIPDEVYDDDDPDTKYISVALLDRGTSGGESVPVYARGPWQELFTGSYNLEFIPHAIGYAASIGPGKKCCEASPSVSSANLSAVSCWWFMVVPVAINLLLEKYRVSFR